MVLSFRQLSAEYSAEYSAKSRRIFGIGRYQFLLYRSFTSIECVMIMSFKNAYQGKLYCNMYTDMIENKETLFYS